MAEIDYYLTKAENRDIVAKYFLDRGFSFVPTLHYTEPKIISVDLWDEIEQYIDNKTDHFYLTHMSISKYELEVVRNEFKTPGFYQIMPKYGGPYLELCCPKQFFNEQILQFAYGFVGIFQHYYKPYSDKLIKIEDSMAKEAYAHFRKYLSKHTEVFKLTNNRTFRVSQAVIEHLKAGAELVGVSNDDLKKIGFY